MYSSTTQNICCGSSACGIASSTAAPRMWNRPYRRSALTHLSATMPASEGMHSEAMPIVEKIAPKLVPDQCKVWNHHVPMVSSHAPQM